MENIKCSDKGRSIFCCCNVYFLYMHAELSRNVTGLEDQAETKMATYFVSSKGQCSLLLLLPLPPPPPPPPPPVSPPSSSSSSSPFSAYSSSAPTLVSDNFLRIYCQFMFYFSSPCHLEQHGKEDVCNCMGQWGDIKQIYLA